MKCPFAKEAAVRFCGVSPFRKMVQRSAIHEEDQRCSTPEYASCPAAQKHLAGRTDQPRCPFLRESVVQYCGAAPVTKFIPSSEGSSRCNNDAHRYCHHYLQRARPARRQGRELQNEEIAMPEGLAFARNHMWLDAGEDGSIHVGVDAFLARVLGEVERVNLVPRNGGQRGPSAVLTVAGADLFLTFPCRMSIAESNVVLRSRPETVLNDPYGAGWLFRARRPQDCEEGAAVDCSSALLRGKEATQWMEREVAGLSTWVHELHARRHRAGESLTADGGVFCPGLTQYLSREELQVLFSRFFALD
jgi:glycine cleavage system H protein